MLVNKLHVFAWRVFLGIWFPKLAFWVKGHGLLVDRVTLGQIALSEDCQFVVPPSIFKYTAFLLSCWCWALQCPFY